MADKLQKLVTSYTPIAFSSDVAPIKRETGRISEGVWLARSAHRRHVPPNWYGRAKNLEGTSGEGVTHVGLWEDAQEHQAGEEEARVVIARRQAAELQEFASGMTELGVAPTAYAAAYTGSKVDDYPGLIRDAQVVGWPIRDHYPLARNGRSGPNAPLLVTPRGDLVNCKYQRAPKRGIFSRESFVPYADPLPWGEGPPEYLSQLLREALAMAMRSQR